MRKYDRTAIRNTDNRIKCNNVEPEDPIRKECRRVVSLVERFTEIYYENPKLFTEQHIVLPVFLSTCSMASCTEPRTELWILKDYERYILNFVRENYMYEWQTMLHEGKFINVVAPVETTGPVVMADFD